MVGKMIHDLLNDPVTYYFSLFVIEICNFPSLKIQLSILQGFQLLFQSFYSRSKFSRFKPFVELSFNFTNDLQGVRYRLFSSLQGLVGHLSKVVKMKYFYILPLGNIISNIFGN